MKFRYDDKIPLKFSLWFRNFLFNTFFEATIHTKPEYESIKWRVFHYKIVFQKFSRRKIFGKIFSSGISKNLKSFLVERKIAVIRKSELMIILTMICLQFSFQQHNFNLDWSNHSLEIKFGIWNWVVRSFHLSVRYS